MIYKKALHDPEILIPGCYLAGGAILSLVTNQEINDYDFYPKTGTKLFDIIYYLLIEEEMVLINESDKALTFKSKNVKTYSGNRMIVQIIKFQTYNSPDEVFSTFDYTVCMGAYDCDTKEFAFHESFYPDIAAKRINYNVDTNYPYASLARLKKYQEKGYSVSKSEMIKIAMSIAKYGELTTWNDLKNAIGGIYGKSIEIGEGLEYSYDNAIKALSEIVFIEPQETTALHDTYKRIMKTESELFYDTYIGGLRGDTFDIIDNTYKKSLVINGDTLANISFATKTNYEYDNNTHISAKDKVIYTDRIIETPKLNPINFDIDGYVVVLNNDAEIPCLLSSRKLNYKWEYVLTPFELNIPVETVALVFRNIGDAMKYTKLKTPDETQQYYKYYKTTFNTSQIHYNYGNDVFYVNFLKVKGL